MPKHKNFKIYRSSAGSGKTYVLSLNYIAISLKGSVQNQTDYYKKILAITFTNKAASEMKMRILYYLDVLSKEKNEDEILQWLRKETKLNKKTIFSHAKKVREHILHHYSDLSISTIDKFTYRIVRSFAKDLGLSQNFELEMDNSKIIQPVVALLISQISNQGDYLSNALVNFALEKAEDGKSYNIEADLEKFSQQLFKEQAADYIDHKTLSLEESKKVKDKLRKRIRSFQKEIKKKSEEVISFLHEKEISPEYFSRKYFYNYFAKNLITFDPQKMRPNTSLINQITEKQLYTKEIKNNSKFSNIKDLIDRNFEKLSSFYFDIQEYLDQHLMEYTSYLAIEKNIYSIMILQQLIKETKDYKNRENIEQISDFNKKIHTIITKQFAAFIYERIGNRYAHYLLDEFQDTSTLQWQNLLPLITDSIDYGKSLVVGDGKQSIYRWRGGEVEQFLKLPSIYKGDKLDFKEEWENKLVTHENLESLEDNFRSKKKIIEFNNLFFSRIKSLLAEDLKDIYNLHAQETKKASEGGYVHLELIKEGEKGFKQEVCNRVVQEIQKLTSKNKYAYRDIAILCNSRKRVSLIAESLTNAEIDVISNEGLLLSKSEHVNVLLAIFEYLQNQDDAVSKTIIIHYLSRNFYTGNKSNEFASELDYTNDLLSTLKTFNITFSITRLLKLPIFQLLERLKKIFKIPEDLYVQFFSDVILRYEQDNRSCLSDFLVWWEEAKEKEAIVMPEKTNAVQIMTVHKSKGLAFNVVIIPFNWEDRKNSQEIWVDTSNLLEEELPAALINTNQALNLSHFAKRYEEEKNLNLLDNLNKLYVATTRSRERLYIFAKEYPKSISETFKSKGNLNSFLYAFQEEFPYTKGDPNECYIKKSKLKDNIFSDKNFEKANWKEIISLKHTVDKYWDTENHLNKVDWGKLLHLALAEIHHLDDKDDVLNRLFASGQCNKQDKERLNYEINSLFNHAKIKQYFTGEWEVKTEREILLSTGETYIPDRLLFKEKEVIILDYKTGIRRKEHENQIDNYAAILEEMGYIVKEKKLIYTKEYLKR